MFTKLRKWARADAWAVLAGFLLATAAQAYQPDSGSLPGAPAGGAWSNDPECSFTMATPTPEPEPCVGFLCSISVTQIISFADLGVAPLSMQSAFMRVTYDYDSSKITGVTTTGGPGDMADVLASCAASAVNDVVVEWTAPTVGAALTNADDTALYYTIEYIDAGDVPYSCTVGWPGGFGSDHVAECKTGSPPAPDNTVEHTERAITSFMLGRANQLTSNQPRLTRYLRGEGCGTFNASGTDAGGSLNGCASQGNVLTEITASWGNGSSYALGTIGAHQFINENFLLGGVVQFDRATDDNNNASGKG